MLRAIGVAADFNVIDEFGRTSTMYPDDVRPFMYAVAHRLSIPRERISNVTVLTADTGFADAGCDAVIDMRHAAGRESVPSGDANDGGKQAASSP
jgi:hypothetical protein